MPSGPGTPLRPRKTPCKPSRAGRRDQDPPPGPSPPQRRPKPTGGSLQAGSGAHLRRLESFAPFPIGGRPGTSFSPVARNCRAAIACCCLRSFPAIGEARGDLRACNAVNRTCAAARNRAGKAEPAGDRFAAALPKRHGDRQTLPSKADRLAVPYPDLHHRELRQAQLRHQGVIAGMRHRFGQMFQPSGCQAAVGKNRRANRPVLADARQPEGAPPHTRMRSTQTQLAPRMPGLAGRPLARRPRRRLAVHQAGCPYVWLMTAILSPDR